MIFPVCSTVVTKDAIESIAARLGASCPITSRDRLTPANLVGSLGMRDYASVLDTDGFELEHFTVSFYVETTSIGEVLSLGSVKSLHLNATSYILTANIVEWKAAILRGLSKGTSKEVREVMNHIFAYLRDNGFGTIFSEYKRGHLPMDKTLYLERI